MDERVNRASSRKFVTTIAWLFIALSILMTIVVIVQYVAFLHTLATIQSIQPGAAPGVQTMTTQLAFLARFGTGFVLLVTSIGLLKRWRWARLAFLALATMGLASNAYRLATALSSISSVPLPEDAPVPELWIVRIAGFLNFAYPIGACLVLGWLLMKFMSRSVRHEFGPGMPDKGGASRLGE
jgi:uncharacterized membrane protein YidH (DUF202 family)